MITLPSNTLWVTDDLAVSIVPGEIAAAGQESGHHRSPDTHLPPLVAPQEWAQYDKPCERCHGTGKDALAVALNKLSAVMPERCGACRDGHQVWEVRWLHDWAIDGESDDVYLSAPATLQVVPVVAHHDHDRPPLHVLVVGSECWLVDGDDLTSLTLDPRPVPGRDFGLIVKVHRVTTDV